MRLVFEDQGWEDYTSWLKNDRKMLARINKLIEDVRRDPFAGIGKPEPLKYHLPGAWSRQLAKLARLHRDKGPGCRSLLAVSPPNLICGNGSRRYGRPTCS
ncbi:Txe/YoeB family addiction module toxin [Streptomyces sp. NPDC018059]|uniref:Txe/YoeB family addiction module toxin n=1 Tax=Streptomyces sp. NPDC018059 TaxID=3365041 RepID=UPI00378AF47A